MREAISVNQSGNQRQSSSSFSSSPDEGGNQRQSEWQSETIELVLLELT
jgi:hypothetical protein